MTKWANKIRRNVKKIKSSPLDDYDTEYLDIDILIQLYITEYVEAKRGN